MDPAQQAARLKRHEVAPDRPSRGARRRSNSTVSAAAISTL
jgi:hypothetical protein